MGDNIDIVCDGKTVSRKHCELKFCEDSWKIVDMGVYKVVTFCLSGIIYFLLNRA